MKSFRVTGIVLLLIAALISCTEEPINQEPLRISQIESHRPEDAPEPHLYARKSISYTVDGRIDYFISESYVANTSVTADYVYSINNDTVTVSNVDDLNGIEYMRFIYENGLLSRYIGKRVAGTTELLDTLDFIYDGNQLVGLDHQGLPYTVEWDENGNIIEISGGSRGSYYFEYDDAPNPLQHLGLDPLVVILTNNTGEHPLYMPYFVQYFSAGNVTRMQFPFNDDWTWSYEYNSAGLPDKAMWFNNYKEVWKYEPVP